MVIEDRVGDRPIAVERAHEDRPLLGVFGDDPQVLVRDDLGVQDAIGPRELANLMQKPGRADDVLLLLATPELDREGLCVRRDGGGVALGRLVAHPQRPDERG